VTGRDLIAILLLTAAAVGSWFFTRSLQGPDEADETRSAFEEGYYFRNARILGTGADGKLLYRIEAERAQQRDGRRVAFENVRIVYTPAAAVPWTLTADTALITDDQESISLSGNVRAIRSDTASETATEVRTQYLELEPARYSAYTNRRVQIIMDAQEISATGMTASLQDNRLELMSNVSGKFSP
jgi:lipopolysaccharide export system protein LptC